MAKRARIRINRTYGWIDKDPVIDEVRTFIQDRGLDGEWSKIATLATMSPATIANWFEGDTRKPQHCSVASVVTGLGGKFKIIPNESEGKKAFELEVELKKAKKWIAENKPRKRKKAEKKRKKAAKRKKKADA
jgi:hypothetical protein